MILSNELSGKMGVLVSSWRDVKEEGESRISVSPGGKYAVGHSELNKDFLEKSMN